MRTKLGGILAVISPYLAWIVSFVLAILNWIALRNFVRAVAVKYLVTMPTEQRVERRIFPNLIMPAVDSIAALALGVMAFGLVIALEYMYREAAASGMLRKRFLLVTAAQVGVIVACLSLTFIVEMI